MNGNRSRREENSGTRRRTRSRTATRAQYRISSVFKRRVVERSEDSPDNETREIREIRETRGEPGCERVHGQWHGVVDRQPVKVDDGSFNWIGWEVSRGRGTSGLTDRRGRCRALIARVDLRELTDAVLGRFRRRPHLERLDDGATCLDKRPPTTRSITKNSKTQTLGVFAAQVPPSAALSLSATSSNVAGDRYEPRSTDLRQRRCYCVGHVLLRTTR